MMMQKQGCIKGHLTQEERVKIYGYIQLKLSLREMGRRLGRSHTTILKEINRNGIDKGWGEIKYCPIKAEGKRLDRRYRANQKHVILWRDWKQRELLEKYLKEKGDIWGPDEILGRIKEDLGREVISTATFYRFIREDKPLLQRFLRFKQSGYRTKNKGNKRKKMYVDVPNIKERPEEINNRIRIGDWEADTIISRKSKVGLITFVDRKSRYCIIKKVGNLEAETINMTINAMLRGEVVRSITFDNGTEFSKIGKLEWQCFRADTYASWQRGSNGKNNGLIRRFIPKGMDMGQFTDEEIQKIQDKTNHKPRKILGYKSSYEVYHNKNLTYIH